ncbi:MAG: calcium-binding protein, partial [Sedimenticola sp.]
SGDDVYFIDLAKSENVVRDEAGTDAIRLTGGINLGEVDFSREGDDLLIRAKSNPDNLTRIVGQYSGDGMSIETLQFDDGSSISLSDVIMGTDSDDWLDGTDGDDILVSGAGNNYLIGGSGDDVYLVDLAKSENVVRDEAGTDTLWLTGGINLGDVDFSREGNDLLIRLKSNPDNLARIVGQYSSDDMSIETLQFDDGSSISLSNVIMGTDSGDTFAGTDGDDLLIGGAGNNDLVGGSGDDVYLVDLAKSENVVRDEAGTDTLWLTGGINLGDVDFSREGNDLLIRAKSNPDNLTRIVGQYSSDGMSIETLQFDDGSSINLSIEIMGTDSGDTFVGTDGDDILVSGAGNNRLTGGSGDDVYFIDLAKSENVVRDEAGTDAIRLTGRINLGEVDFSREGDDLLISAKSNPDNLTRIVGQYSSDGMSIETLQFDDGSSISLSDVIMGTDSDDWLDGTDGDDILVSGAGNNYLIGGSGDDVYLVDLAKSENVVRDEAGTDTIWLTGGINLGDIDFSREGDDLLISSKSNPDNLTRIVGQYSSDDSVEKKSFFSDSVVYDNRSSIETLQFDDGSSINIDTNVLSFSQQDWIEGTDGDDLLIGGAGNNILYGGDGDDIFHFGSLSDSSLEDWDVILYFNENDDVIDLHKLDIAYSDLVMTEQNDWLTIVEVEGTDFAIRVMLHHGDLLPEHFIF